MRLKRLLLIPVAAAATTALAMGPATAGEVNGVGKPDPGAEYGPGARPQNWGHTKQDLRAAGKTTAQIQATRPGVTCNGHTGLIATGGGK